MGGFFHLHSHASNLRSQRIIVQHVKEGERWTYRLIAYDERRTYRPANFNSIEEVVRAVASVAPDFCESDLQLRPEADRSYIAFSAEWELSEAQLARLGLV